MVHRLRQLSIAGFKSIRDATVEFHNINVLIGANGAGKSNLVSCFGFLHDIIAGRLGAYVARHGGANALMHFGRKVSPQITFKPDFSPNGYEAVLAPTTNDALFFAREACWFHAPGSASPLQKELGAGHTESKLPSEEGIAGYVLDLMPRTWRPICIGFASLVR
ncbi:MAG TPA: AAA family ATPase [Kofleriaceae bacterium]|nr:AAA family ATPase [Kofleriaceae bacterium]